MHTEVGGAYTGEVSPRMLKGLCEYVLVGQYERRILFGDKEAIVRRKVQSAQEQGLKPILCVGENADQLDEGLGLFVVAEQVEADLDGARLDDTLVIAYEPAWTTMGRVAPPPVSYVVDIVGHIRDTLAMLYSRKWPTRRASFTAARSIRETSQRSPPSRHRRRPGRCRQHQLRQFHEPGQRLRQPISLKCGRNCRQSLAKISG